MSVVDDIIKIAKSDNPEQLLEMTVSVSHESLYDAAIDAYGSWDAALVAALEFTVRSKSATSSAPARNRPDLEFERRPGIEAHRPVYASTSNGVFFYIDGKEFEVTVEPERLDLPYGAGVLDRFQYIGTTDAVFMVSNLGRFYGLDQRMMPQWMGESDVRRMGAVFPFENDEAIWFVMPRSAMNGGRLIHITRQAKGKATDVDQFGKSLDRSGKEAFLLNDGDEPVAVLYGPEDSHVFAASAHGQGIHFDAGADMRSMGRKAVGVNIMKLDGPDDELVSAFMTDGVEQAAMVTQKGLGKRVWFDEFRPQGRGGSGMQVCKLETGDRVVGVVPSHPGEDIVISTSIGRVHRMGAHHLPLMGRPAKGNSIIDLAPGEEVISVAALPCGSRD